MTNQKRGKERSPPTAALLVNRQDACYKWDLTLVTIPKNKQSSSII
jgi:hypothetical protein